jgi:hypothetical protein
MLLSTDLDTRVVLLQEARHTGDRAAGASTHDERVQLAIALSPQLRPGARVVAPEVGQRLELVRKECCTASASR